jgi:hypothetical protein
VQEKLRIEAAVILLSALQISEEVGGHEGIEPLTPCFQSRDGKTLNALLVPLTRKTIDIPVL